MRALLPVLLATVLVASPALADKGGHGDHDERERLEHAQEKGDVLPLARILELLRAEGITGEVLEVELENEDDGFVYEIYLLGPDGRRLEVKVDPATGKILSRGTH